MTTAVRQTVRASLDRYDGGLNLRDQANQMAGNETPDCMNVTPDARGGAFLRLGLSLIATLTGLGPVTNMLYSQALGLVFAQVGTDLYSSSNLSSWTSRKTFSTSAVVSLIEFNGKVLAGHPVDGIFSFDPTVATLTMSVTPTTLAAWKNKVWAAWGVHVRWSEIGDATSWPTDNSVDVRMDELADEPITALQPAQSLLIWRRRGLAGINNEQTGAYRFLSGDGGAAGHLAVTEVAGLYIAINDNGIWQTDGVSAPVRVSDKVQPLFAPAMLNFAKLSLWCATTHRDRAVFSVCGESSTINSLTLDYHPAAGWIVPYDFGISAFTKFGTNRVLYGAKAQSAGDGKVFQVFKGGSDDGAAIAGRYTLPWLTPADGLETRLRMMRVVARGDLRLYVRKNFERVLGELYPVDSPPTPGGTWGTSKWGQFQWGSRPWQYDTDLWELGHARDWAFQIRMSQTAAVTAPPVLGEDGIGDEAGSAGLYALYPEFIPLGDS